MIYSINKNINAKPAALGTLGGLVIKFYPLKKTSFHIQYFLTLVKPLSFTEMAELHEKNSIIGNFTQSMLDSVAILKLQPFISCFL